MIVFGAIIYKVKDLVIRNRLQENHQISSFNPQNLAAHMQSHSITPRSINSRASPSFFQAEVKTEEVNPDIWETDSRILYGRYRSKMSIIEVSKTPTGNNLSPQQTIVTPDIYIKRKTEFFTGHNTPNVFSSSVSPLVS